MTTAQESLHSKDIIEHIEPAEAKAEKMKMLSRGLELFRKNIKSVVITGAVVTGAAVGYEKWPSKSHGAHGESAPVKAHASEGLLQQEKRIQNRLDLYRLTDKAEEAMRLVTLCNGDREVLQQCLEDLQEWEQKDLEVNGKLVRHEVNGLVKSQPHEHAAREDMWDQIERHKKMIDDMLNAQSQNADAVTSEEGAQEPEA